MALSADILRGYTDTIILHQLSHGDSYGYQINKTISTLSGGEVELKEATLDMLGHARQVKVNKENTTIVDGAGDKDQIAARVGQIKAQIAETTSDYDREKLQERLAKLAGGVAVIQVGAATEVEMKERKLRIEDALAATRAALCLLLSVLTFCYAGPLHQDATTVLAAKRILPVYSVERDDRVISISFDASWGGDQTMRILDLLDEYNAKATFFLVGIWVDKYPELVKEIHDRGHEIGNHSSKHPHMTKISESRMRQELSDMAEKLEAITGEKPTLFRPPYGDYNNTVVSVARSEGYEVVQWSIDSLDWKNKGAADLIRRATTNVAPGDIVLFHNDSKYILDALPTILKTYHQQGFTLIPVGELLLEGNTTIDVQGRQHPAKAE